MGSDVDGVPQVENLQVGFANHFKLGCWTSADIRLSGAIGDSGTSGRLMIEAPDGDGTPARFTGPELNWTAGGNHLAYFQSGRKSPVDVLLRRSIRGDASDRVERLTVAGDTKPPIAVSATDEFIVELGASIGLAQLYAKQDANQVDHITVTTVESAQRLPDKWYGYDGVNLLAIAGVPAIDKGLLDDTAVDAIEQWVRLGGTVLIACGDRAEEVFGSGKPLARFAPGTLDETVHLRNVGAVEHFAGAEEQKLDAQWLAAPQWGHLTADRIELDAGSGQAKFPLVTRSGHGMGQVIVVGLDLYNRDEKNPSPLAVWPGRAKFLDRLLHGRSMGGENLGQAQRLGYTDISGQLRGALDQYTEISLVPFWAVVAVALAYIAVLFPLSYFVVHRWLGRQAVAWILFPATIVLFAGIAYAWTCGSKGDRIYANQLDLIDVDLHSGRARGTTWFNMYSPQNQSFDLRLMPSSPTVKDASANSTLTYGDHCLLSWLGLAGSGLGGMESKAASAPISDEPYTIDLAAGKIQSVPVSTWSSKNFIARYEATGGGIEANLTAAASGRLQGPLINLLGAPLKNCFVFFGDFAYPVGELPPRLAVSIGSIDYSPRSVLTGQSQLRSQQQPPPYDRTDSDPLRVLQVMMFYQTASGANYTGLLNRYQSFVDLSAQLDYGRAILVGEGPPASTMEVNGRKLDPTEINRHDTVYRFLIDVARRD